MKKIFLIIFVSALLLSPMIFVNTANGANDIKTGLSGALPALNSALGDDRQGLAPNLESGIGNIIGGVLALVGTIFLILTVYGGITWMIAMGNSDKTEKAKEIIVAAVIGLAITMGAYAITVFVTGRLQGNIKNTGICINTNSKSCNFSTREDCSIVQSQQSGWEFVQGETECPF